MFKAELMDTIWNWAAAIYGHIRYLYPTYFSKRQQSERSWKKEGVQWTINAGLAEFTQAFVELP